MWIRQCASLKPALRALRFYFLNLFKPVIFIPSHPFLFPRQILAVEAIEPLKSTSFESVVLNVILNQEQKGELFVKITEDGDFLIKVDDLKT